MNSAWQSIGTIIKDLVVASIVSGFILWLDNVLTNSKENHELDSGGRIQEREQ